MGDHNVLNRQAMALLLLFNIMVLNLMLTRFDEALATISKAAHIEAPEPDYLIDDSVCSQVNQDDCRLSMVALTHNRSSLPFSQ